MRRSSSEKKSSNILVFCLVVLVSAAALYALLIGQFSVDESVHQLALKIFSLVGFGAVIAITLSSLSRFDELDR